MDRLQGMEIFVKVAQQGSLTAAADRLGMAKSTVSKHIAALEARLGVRLINRTTRRFSLTELGERYVEQAQAILQSVDETESTLARAGGEPRGRLRIGAPMTFGLMHLGPALLRFMRRYPEIRVDLALNDRRVDLIEEGFDVAVRIGRLEDSSLMARRLARLPYVCAASPAYVAKHGQPETPRDLRRHNCLRYTYSSTPGEWLFRDRGREERVRIDGCFTANNGDVLTLAAIEGLGIVYGPDFTLRPALDEGRLVPILTHCDVRTIDLHAVFPPQRPLPLKLRVLIDFLLEDCGALERAGRHVPEGVS